MLYPITASDGKCISQPVGYNDNSIVKIVRDGAICSNSASHAIPNFSLCLQAVTVVCHALSCLLYLAVSCHRHCSNAIVELATGVPKSA